MGCIKMNFNLQETLGFTYYILVYGVGFLAMAFCVCAYQFRRRATIILCNCFGQLCWVIYFLLQSDFTSAIACALTALMLSVFSKKDKWKWATHPVSIIFFILLLSGFSMLSFKVWSDIFPLLAGIFAVIGNSCATEKRLRQFSILWCLFWMMNSISKVYPVAFANDFMCTASAVISLIRYRDKNNARENIAV